MNQVIQGDCLEVMRGMADCSVDAVVTDPPYGLSFMCRAWDYDVPKVEIWREVLRVLKPGGHLLSFAGTRTQHRMAVNIEIEMEPEYVAIANARIAAAAARSEKASLEQRVAWLETQVQAQGAKLKRIEAQQQLSLWEVRG